MFSYTLHDEKTKAVLFFEGDIDIEVSEIIEEEIEPLLSKYEDIELDLGKVHFVDSTGIGLLLQFVYASKENNTTISISNVNPEVYEVFALLQVPEIIGTEIFQSK
jgi:anti-sigma B factor antagonist